MVTAFLPRLRWIRRPPRNRYNGVWCLDIVLYVGVCGQNSRSYRGTGQLEYIVLFKCRQTYTHTYKLIINVYEKFNLIYVKYDTDYR